MKHIIESNKLLKKAVRYERQFKMNKYDGDIKAKDSYLYQKGNIPILLSAPHSVNHIRQGKIKYADMYTGSIIRVMHEVTGCHVIYKLRNDGVDPNYDSLENDNGYKQMVIDTIKENDIKLCIDLHGAAEDRDIDIDIGTDDGETLNGFGFLPEVIRIILGRYGLSNIGHNKIFSADPTNNITNSVGRLCKIPALQFEVNKRHRDFDTYIDNYTNLIDALYEIISFFKGFDWNPDTYIFKVEKSDKHIPIDKVEFSMNDTKGFGLQKNDTFQIQAITCMVEPCSMIARYKIQKRKNDLEDGKIYLTNKLYKETFKEIDCDYHHEHVIVQKSRIKDIAVGIPRVGIEKILLGSELIKNLDTSKVYQLYNRSDDIDHTLEYIEESEQGKNTNKVFLNYYQRQLMNINIPKKVIPLDDFNMYLNNPELSDDNKKILIEAYEDKIEYFKIKSEYIENASIKDIFKVLKLDKLELVELKGIKVLSRRSLKNRFSTLIHKLLMRLINSKTISLRTGRPYPTDEDSAIVRIMPNTMKTLGISELDKVVVRHRNKKIVLRALEFDSLEILQGANQLVYDEIDASVIIGIPAKYRGNLEIYSLNSIVTVSRDMNYLFMKNSNNQMLPIIAVIFTILQTFPQAIHRIWLSCLFIPLAIYISLSQERSKIDNKNN